MTELEDEGKNEIVKSTYPSAVSTRKMSMITPWRFPSTILLPFFLPPSGKCRIPKTFSMRKTGGR